MTEKKKVLDPVIVARLSGMMIRARFVVESFISGMHQSPLKGYSLEFAQHREYSPGDDIKHLDWKVYAKSDRYYVKQYEEETSMKCYILLDKSASMGYSSGSVSKLDYGAMLAAALAYLMIIQHDSVGLGVFDDSVRKLIPPRQGTQHLSVIMNRLEELQPFSRTGISRALQEVGPQVKRRGLVIIISDLLDEQDEVLKALKHFRYKKNEVIVFHLLDKGELRLPRGESVLYQDMESGEKILSEPDIIRKEYGRVVENFMGRYKMSCRDSDIDYCHINTSEPLDKALGLYLSRREKFKQ